MENIQASFLSLKTTGRISDSQGDWWGTTYLKQFKKQSHYIHIFYMELHVITN
ncbi:hypothetical protein JOC85_002461 [Bacillus mesophilus]|nr:hypothetical protein [Bacillus mesophilus]